MDIKKELDEVQKKIDEIKKSQETLKKITELQEKQDKKMAKRPYNYPYEMIWYNKNNRYLKKSTTIMIKQLITEFPLTDVPVERTVTEEKIRKYTYTKDAVSYTHLTLPTIYSV